MLLLMVLHAAPAAAHAAPAPPAVGPPRAPRGSPLRCCAASLFFCSPVNARRLLRAKHSLLDLLDQVARLPHLHLLPPHQGRLERRLLLGLVHTCLATAAAAGWPRHGGSARAGGKTPPRRSPCLVASSPPTPPPSDLLSRRLSLRGGSCGTAARPTMRRSTRQTPGTIRHRCVACMIDAVGWLAGSEAACLPLPLLARRRCLLAGPARNLRPPPVDRPSSSLPVSPRCSASPPTPTRPCSRPSA